MDKDLKTITLSKFLSRYVMLTGKGLKNVTHEDVKNLFPYLKRCSFEDAKQLKNVLYVFDGKNTVPYIIPDENLSCDYANVESDKKNRTIQTKEFCDMTIQELLCLLNTKFNKHSTSKKARRELENRGYTLKRTYKIKKYEEMIKSIEIY